MTPDRRGLAAALGAYGLWGLAPLFWPLLNRSGAVEILAHRIVWSAVVSVLLVAVFARSRWRTQVSGRGTWWRLAVASTVIAVNWGVYIWAVNHDRVTEAALGYYINPLLSILAGVLLFSERLATLQWVAIALAATAVVIVTLDYGHPPWVSLMLAVSFTIYGIIKKGVQAEPIVSLAAESVLMAAPGLGYLIWLGMRGRGDFGQHGIGYDLLLVSAGIITAVPLLLFAFAAHRMALSLLAITQYVAPTLQFLLGVLYFAEAMSTGRWVGFVLVWVALMIISAHAILVLRRTRRPASAAEPA